MEKIYAAWHKEYLIRKSCASGGIFYITAKQLIESGGVVVGAAFDQQFRVSHIIVEDVESLEKLKRSKYVQSNLKGIFEKVKSLLKSDKIVLFSGTPCQVRALKRYLNEDFENLICCAVFCYGTPEKMVYEKYLAFLEEKAKSKICAINFKDKRYGWDYYTTEICFENGKKECQFGGDSYKEAMRRGYSLCRACLTCDLDYRNTDADIMLGDFYTVAEYLNVKIPRNGVNCVILKTMKGEKLFERTEGINYYIINKEQFYKKEKPKKRTFDYGHRELFLKILKEKNYEEACKTANIYDKPLSIKMKIIALSKRLGIW